MRDVRIRCESASHERPSLILPIHDHRRLPRLGLCASVKVWILPEHAIMKPSIFAALCALGVLFATPVFAQKSTTAREAQPAAVKESVPLEKLPDWAIPQSYKL